ncbi:putative ABC transport system permease protein [Croceifilum oryzae]|uniref:ABC transport system permease protein n=1 Tax=Croceifilum oryzae TaxID=1553429 RepID=A0AAJ1WPS7_9BACL|nr:ABC transporter permease [Croceifilum oryzae]MDQ0416817.1 putative ABC transport system permease protein [Croceifilum oryzae]
MNFRQFALNNVKRNARAYSAYFLSSVFAVMVFFTYAVFIFHPSLDIPGLRKVMGAAVGIAYVFSFLFVFYSISIFLKSRNKELGILTILGAQKKQIRKLIFLENILIGIAAIVIGMICGLACAKLILLYGANILEIKLPFYLPLQAMGLTAGAFFVLYIVLSFSILAFIRQKKALELLMGTSKPKKEPKAHILLILLSIGLIATAYYFSSKSFTYMKEALVSGIMGIYFFFTQFCVFLMRLLKRNRSFYWRGTKLLWVSEMSYKLKDNARMFFMVTIVIIMASSAISLVHYMDYETKEAYRENPFAITFSDREGKDWASGMKKIDLELEKAGLTYEKVISKSIWIHGGLHVIKESDYPQLAKLLEMKVSHKLKSREAILISPESKLENSRSGQQIEQELKEELSVHDLQIVQRIDKTIELYNAFVVVNDQTYQQIEQKQREKNQAQQNKANPENISIYYFVPDWSNQKFPRSDSKQAKLSKVLEGIAHEDGHVKTRAVSYLEKQKEHSMMSFIGILIAAIFSLATGSFLYFKLYSDLNDDQRIYQMLSRIGLSTREMKWTCTIQMAMLFFIPFIVAGLVSVSVSVLQVFSRSSFQAQGMLTSSLISITGFFVVQLVYFLIIRALYLKEMNKVMVESMH